MPLSKLVMKICQGVREKAENGIAEHMDMLTQMMNFLIPNHPDSQSQKFLIQHFPCVNEAFISLRLRCDSIPHNPFHARSLPITIFPIPPQNA